MSRPEVVKTLWKVIKERGLQDPIDKRYILCDGQLEALLGGKRVQAFKMNKALQKHFYTA